MDETLIQNWNSVVRDSDVVWLLGDVFFHQVSKAHEIMARLRGKINLVLGNHDKLIRNQRPLAEKFDGVHGGLVQTYIAGTYVVMCHYPLLTWDRAHHGSYMLHGHCHGNIPFDEQYRRLDVGVDCHSFAPLAWEDVRRKLEKVEPKDARSRPER